MNRRLQALGRLPSGELNRMELRYRAELELQKRAGKIHEYWAQAFKFRIAGEGDACWYTPDFVLQLNSGHLVIHEVKGEWMDDAKVKTKVCSDKYPFPVFIVTAALKRDGGGFKVEEL